MHQCFTRTIFVWRFEQSIYVQYIYIFHYPSIKKTADHGCRFVRSITDQQVEQNGTRGCRVHTLNTPVIRPPSIMSQISAFAAIGVGEIVYIFFITPIPTGVYRQAGVVEILDRNRVSRFARRRVCTRRVVILFAQQIGRTLNFETCSVFADRLSDAWGTDWEINYFDTCRWR